MGRRRAWAAAGPRQRGRGRRRLRDPRVGRARGPSGAPEWRGVRPGHGRVALDPGQRLGPPGRRGGLDRVRDGGAGQERRRPLRPRPGDVAGPASGRGLPRRVPRGLARRRSGRQRWGGRPTSRQGPDRRCRSRRWIWTPRPGMSGRCSPYEHGPRAHPRSVRGRIGRWPGMESASTGWRHDWGTDTWSSAASPSLGEVWRGGRSDPSCRRWVGDFWPSPRSRRVVDGADRRWRTWMTKTWRWNVGHRRPDLQIVDRLTSSGPSAAVLATRPDGTATVLGATADLARRNWSGYPFDAGRRIRGPPGAARVCSSGAVAVPSARSTPVRSGCCGVPDAADVVDATGEVGLPSVFDRPASDCRCSPGSCGCDDRGRRSGRGGQPPSRRHREYRRCMLAGTGDEPGDLPVPGLLPARAPRPVLPQPRSWQPAGSV